MNLICPKCKGKTIYRQGNIETNLGIRIPMFVCKKCKIRFVEGRNDYEELDGKKIREKIAILERQEKLFARKRSFLAERRKAMKKIKDDYEKERQTIWKTYWKNLEELKKEEG